MDLIYADSDRKDIGIMQSYTLDIAYGDDENDFECIIDRSGPVSYTHRTLPTILLV